MSTHSHSPTHSHRRHDRPRSRSKRSPTPPPASLNLVPMDACAFMTLMSTALRLREETLSMAYMYRHRYRAFFRVKQEERERGEAGGRLERNAGEVNEGGGGSGGDPLDEYTLALACLSLSTKSTSSPRRLRELLIPAYALLQPTSPALTIPSTHYDTLRSTVVTAELLVLRVLEFNIRLTLPYVYLPRMLECATTLDGTEHFDEMRIREREEADVVDVVETAIGREARRLCAVACRSYRLGGLFPAREVAAAVVRVAVERCGVGVDDGAGGRKWVKRVAGERVEVEDWEEAVEELRAVMREEEEHRNLT